MQFEILPVTAFEQNCSLVIDPQTRKAAFIDPGGDIDDLQQAALDAGVQVEKILLTHGHIDHCGQAGILAKRLGVPIEGPHRDDDFWIQQLKTQGMMFGMGGAETFTPDRWLEEGDTVSVGLETMSVVHCPGHTPGHVVFVHGQDRLAFVGDVLFAGSIGRTDFPKGNLNQLLDSIKTKLFPLGDDIRFVPGHGPMSTFGQERQTNPYVGGR
jgi:glyoxylase-like metal-dependent hydrolase (beta-lactamase superfamily II)